MTLSSRLVALEAEVAELTTDLSEAEATVAALKAKLERAEVAARATVIEQCAKVAEERAQTLREYSAEAEVVGSKDDVTWNLRSAELCEELAAAIRALLP